VSAVRRPPHKTPAPADAAGSASPPAHGVRYSLRALRHRDFSVFFWAAVVSNSGTWLQSVTVPFVLFSLTRSETWVGMATFAQFLPTVLFGPAGGSLADGRDRRRVLLVTQSLMAGAAGAMWLYWASGGRRPAVVLGLVALGGVFGGLNIPSWQAFVPSLVPRSDLLSAIALNSLQFNAARALGPAIAGLVLARFGPSGSFALNAVSFAGVIVALRMVRPRADAPARSPGPQPKVIAGFVQALRYVRGQPGIAIGLVIALVIGFLGNPVVQFTVVFAKDVYHVNDLAYGLLTGALGIGAVAAAPLVSGWDHVVSRSTIVRIAFPLYGLGIALFGLSRSYAVGFIALIIVGAGFLSVITATNTAVQIIVADRVRGRVMAARVMSFTLAFSFGGLIQGALAERFGAHVTVTGAGLALAAAATVLAVHPRWLSRLDDPPDDTPDPAAATTAG